ncbi:MAG TPA: hypothetical protein VGF28_02615 [Thermoanaerobaculia bacterium]
MTVFDTSGHGWRTRDVIFTGVLAATAFAAAFLLGAGVILATGIPATGGMANIFPVVFLAVLGYKICPRPFFGTLTMAIVFLLAIPTVIGGPLGPLKLVNGIIIGLVWDLIIVAGRRKNGAIIVASGVAAVVSLLCVYAGLIILKLPAVGKLRPLVLPLSGIQAVLGVVAAYLALKIYDARVSKWPAVQRFQRAGA